MRRRRVGVQQPLLCFPCSCLLMFFVFAEGQPPECYSFPFAYHVYLESETNCIFEHPIVLRGIFPRASSFASFSFLCILFLHLCTFPYSKVCGGHLSLSGCMASEKSLQPLELQFTTRCSNDDTSETDAQCVRVCVEGGVVFQCPASMLREGCLAMSELFPPGSATSGNATAGDNVKLPALSIEGRAFENVALYLEHFYNVPASDSPVDCDAATDLKDIRPTSLSCPLQFQELYELTEWEHRFVVQRLLMLPREKWYLCKEGKWVDLISGAGVARGMMIDVSHLLRVLNAAVTLDIPPLRCLCGAVFANLLLDLDEVDMLELMGVKEQLGPEEEQALVKAYPWLSL
ncbi:hypothetical protein, conserved [Trypanosoma brucei gambiense DAL972]|uniref:Uncharacterized protein n=2 Tax=Trypanosoma brucei TaxID=5691 RepID=D0A5L2_TRYB9|nr:hypothetical protein, conserved [Trypanosoma brucei gambiense DAL972]RHW68356.1 hypothetical protein DPX39_110012100 [Trypanosoma brucei equiperdum]CBH16963.1 hypothetical protein, conserved [Trypanosoma brucei gambiense DAL972]|eukprot:XP_011779227.1 hypothetical protein, conserved [Trypanosoma brucei gambiense DAL972]